MKSVLTDKECNPTLSDQVKVLNEHFSNMNETTGHFRFIGDFLLHFTIF